jgi:hypothetical protein
VYGSTDALVCAASAEHLTHRLIDLIIGWVYLLLQKRDGSHDLARLAVAALGNLFLDPCTLDGV